jgi:hypothetical protein
MKAFPHLHQVHVTRDTTYLHSLWLAIWNTLMMVFAVILFQWMLRQPIKAVWAWVVTLVKMVFETVRMFIYGVLGGLGSREISLVEWIQEKQIEMLKSFGLTPIQDAPDTVPVDGPIDGPIEGELTTTEPPGSPYKVH